MTKPLILSGVPGALLQDGWWLSSSVPPPQPPTPAQHSPARLPPAPALAALVALGDALFWAHAPGLSLAVFAAAVFLIATARAPNARRRWRPALLLALALAPAIDLVQPLSVLLLLLGLAGALIWAWHPDASLARITAGATRFLIGLPRDWVLVLPRALRSVRLRRTPAQLLRDWAFPLAGALVLGALLMQANPMLARLLQIRPDLWWAVAQRLFFWAGIALLVAPALIPAPPLPDVRPQQPRLPGFGLNARSVLRALVLFNLLLAVQMLTDATILLAGASLPAGMDHAEYAHRGAYPLLATAALAGLFALAARPFWAEDRRIRPLLLLWLGQNVILCGAAALRLDLYVTAYGLTLLRLHALVWMALVALGLGLIAAQLALRRGSGWLLARLAGLGLGTLYLAAFVNFSGVVASYNLTRGPLDPDYLCSLGPMAAGPIYETLSAPARENLTKSGYCAALAVPPMPGWREWGFRSWRVHHKVAAALAVPPAPQGSLHEDPRR